MKFVVANVERLLTKMLCKSKGGLSCFGKCNDDVEGLGALVSAVPQSGEFHKMISTLHRNLGDWFTSSMAASCWA